MPTMYEEGNPNSKLAVLAQAPGRQEAAEHRPLVGPSGSVFKECLHAAGITRGDCYILNVWEDVVRTDKNGDIYSPSGGPALWNKNGITSFGFERAEPTLERLRKSGAQCILSLGQQALELCTGKSDRIMKWRGSPLEGLQRIGGKSVIPTVHPAATIHGVYLWRYLIISDMKKAKRHSANAKLTLPLRNIHIRPTIADALGWLRRCQRIGAITGIATDIEVVNHQTSCFSVCTDPHEGMTIPLVDEDGPYWSEEDEVLIWQEYGKLMNDQTIMKINQNIVGFDAPFLLMQNHIRTRGEIGDTMIAQHVLYPEFNKGLDFIASIHTDEPYWKDEGKMWKNEGGDYPQFWRYCGKDSCVALEAWDVLSNELTQRDMWTTYERTAKLNDSLTYMTIYGLAVDQERLNETKAKIEAEIEEKINELNETAEYPFNAVSPAQCKKYFYDTKGITPYRNPQGGVTTDDKAMSRIFRKTNLREAKLVQEIRNLTKLKGTYLDVETDSDHRLRCSWNPRGTWTGRLSSSKTIRGTGLNLANLDPRFKSFIVAD